MIEKYKQKLQTLVAIADANLRHKTMMEIAEGFELTFDEVENDFTNIWSEELDRRVKIIEQEGLDFAVKSLKKEQIDRWLRSFIADKKERDNLIQSKLFKDEPVKVYTLKDLFGMRKSRNSKYFVTGLFQSGLYLVVAQAKSGKSLLGYDMSNSLCRGLPFLKRKTVRTNVLIVQNEEELSSTGRKIENNGLQELQRENPEEYQQLIESHRLIVTKGLDINVDLQKILNIIDEYSIGALIVDSFRASIGKGGLTEYDIGAASALYQLQSAVHERSMLCVVIHHANKSDNNSGKTAAFNGVGGHNALTGANDGVIKLSLNPEKRVDGKETIDINFFPRNDNPCKFNVLYSEGEACKWGFEVLDESTLSDAMVANICSILMSLDELYRDWIATPEEERPEIVGGKTIDQIALDTGIERALLVKILNYMEQNEALGRYSQSRKWVYHIPAEGSELYYLLEEAERKSTEAKRMEELLQTVYQDILACKTIEEYDEYRFGLDDEIRELARKKMPEECVQHISRLRKPPKFEVGDYVTFTNTQDNTGYEVLDIVFKGIGSNSGDHRWLYKLKGMEDTVQYFEIEKIAKPDVTTSTPVGVEVVKEEDIEF
jgi:hypothetical protein